MSPPLQKVKTEAPSVHLTKLVKTRKALGQTPRDIKRQSPTCPPRNNIQLGLFKYDKLSTRDKVLIKNSPETKVNQTKLNRTNKAQKFKTKKHNKFLLCF